MKYKYEHGWTNPETGNTTVVLKSKYGLHKGTVRMHPEDIKYKNKIFGYDIAEKRAIINLLKTKLKYEKIKLKTIRDLKNDFEYVFTDPIPSYVKRRIHLKLRDYSDNIKYLQNEIKQLESIVATNIELKNSFNEKRSQKEK